MSDAYVPASYRTQLASAMTYRAVKQALADYEASLKRSGGSGHEHAVCDAMGSARQDPQPEPREDVRVVDLIHGNPFAVAEDRRERTAGADDGAGLRPRN